VLRRLRSLVNGWRNTKSKQVRTALPAIPRPKGKIERWHQTLKNRILLENYFFQETSKPRSRPSSSTTTIERYHESLEQSHPADVYFGRGQTILLERERIKRDTIRQRRLNHQAKAA
jgi:putative transposase